MTLREQFNKAGFLVVKKGVRVPAKSFTFTESVLASKLSQSVHNYANYMQLIAHNVNTVSMLSKMITVVGNELIDRPSMVGLPVLHAMSPRLKIPDGYYGAAAHQDWPSVQGGLDMVTVWIALTDAGIGNFPLEVIPGSHKRGLREGKPNGSVLEVEADDKDFIPIECEAGDVVFLSGFTVHRTGNGTGFRLAVSQRFDNATEPSFIERGYPCAQKTVVDREIKWKPTVGQVRAVYD